MKRRLGLRRALALGVCAALASLLATGPGGLVRAARADAPYYIGTPPTKGALYTDGPDNRWLLGGQWLMQADPGDQGLSDGWWRGGSSTTGWNPVTVPNSFNAGDLSSASMQGSVAWYRRDFVVPAAAFPSYVPASSRHWIVRFESVNYRATVWLNGRQLGGHAGAYLPFELAITGLHPGINQLIVRVDDRRGANDLPPGPGGGWWNFGGIQREVYLRAVSGVDLASVRVRPSLPCPSCVATVDELATVRNLTGTPQTVHLQGSYGALPVDFGSHLLPAGGTWSAHDVITLARPRLWAPDDPQLYRARLVLDDGRGRRIAGYTVLSGVRSVAVDPNGLLELNGRRLSLRGVNLHEQDAIEGAALDPGRLARLMGWVRALGAGIVRAHYPLNPELEEAADRNGILLWSEIPAYQLSAQALATPSVIDQAKSELAADIATNQDHPSILLWSIGNELPTPPPPAEVGYIAGAAALAHRLDPTRPVGMAISSWPGVPCEQAYAPLDVIGFNDYFGWFDAGGGSTDDRTQLGPYLDYLRTCYPTQAVMVTEFGFEADRHGPSDERGTDEFQADALRYHMSTFATRPWLAAAIYFAMQDFAAHPGWGGGNPYPNPPWVQKGVVDQYGHLKPNFGLMQSLFGAVEQIAPVPRASGSLGPSGARPSGARTPRRS